MNQDQAEMSAIVAACAKEVSAYILNRAAQAEQDQLAFLVNVAALLSASALAAQPEERLAEASAHMQKALGLIHCRDDDE